MASLELAFDILARDKASGAFKSAGDSADGFKSKLSNIGTVAKTALAGTAIGAIAGLGAAMATGVKDAVSYETLQNKTAAVLKSTGNAAGTSVKNIQSMAAKLESLSGVDEELIINGQNVLATFTKVRNETGKGNKIFDRATASALDMSVALGTDMQSAVTMVGKALNDPIAGLTAMSKAGIQFTDQQKDQIKWLVENGRQLDAQKIILGELETQFGGTAEAAGSGLAGDMARLKDVFSDTFRELATRMLPMLTDVAAYLSENLPGAIDRVSSWFTGTLVPALAPVVAAFRDDILPAVKVAVEEGFAALSLWWDNNGETVLGAIDAFKTGVQWAFGAVIEAGQFVIDHWNVFEPIFAAIAALVITHYVRLGVAAATSSAIQIAAWVRLEAAAIASAAKIATAWATALGPAALVIAAAEKINNLTGDKMNPNDLNLWERLNPWEAFKGLDIGLENPFGSNANGTSNWRGGWSWVGEKGPELLNLPQGSQVVPNRQSMEMFDAVGEDQLYELRQQNGLLRTLVDRVGSGLDPITSGRASVAVML